MLRNINSNCIWVFSKGFMAICLHFLMITFSAIANSDCLVFDTAVAKMFSENGNLGINVTISQTVNSMNYKSEPQWLVSLNLDFSNQNWWITRCCPSRDDRSGIRNPSVGLIQPIFFQLDSFLLLSVFEIQIKQILYFQLSIF